MAACPLFLLHSLGRGQKQDEEDLEEQDLKDHNDVIAAKYLKLENSVSFLDYSIFTVELPVSEHKCPEVLEAKDK